MLDQDKIIEIEKFVHQKPRSIQEIALLLRKNWRTADRYVDEIQQTYGTISTRTFREGTRGALKIVFYSGIEGISHSIFQQQLEAQIASGRQRDDFFPFDIFQYVEDSNKKVESGNIKEINDNFVKMLMQAKKQVLIFSGNLTFINEKYGRETYLDILEKLVQKKVQIKVICRVDIVGKKNVEKLLALNFKYNKEYIQIKHREQPLRGIIIDNQICRLKETRSEEVEIEKEINLYYTINQREWVEWLSKLFWKMYSTSVDAQTRLVALGRLIKEN